MYEKKRIIWELIKRHLANQFLTEHVVHVLCVWLHHWAYLRAVSCSWQTQGMTLRKKDCLFLETQGQPTGVWQNWNKCSAWWNKCKFCWADFVHFNFCFTSLLSLQLSTAGYHVSWGRIMLNLDGNSVLQNVFFYLLLLIQCYQCNKPTHFKVKHLSQFFCDLFRKRSN